MHASNLRIVDQRRSGWIPVSGRVARCCCSCESPPNDGQAVFVCHQDQTKMWSGARRQQKGGADRALESQISVQRSFSLLHAAVVQSDNLLMDGNDRNAGLERFPMRVFSAEVRCRSQESLPGSGGRPVRSARDSGLKVRLKHRQMDCRRPDV